MDALLGAYRMGARVTFREMSRRSMEEGLGPAVVVDLGESIMAYIDELSAASVAGHNADPVNCTDLGGTIAWGKVLGVVATVGEIASFMSGPWHVGILNEQGGKDNISVALARRP